MTQHNIFQEIEEDLARQKYADLWKRYGNLVIAVALAIVLGTAATTYWNSMRAEKNQQASAGLAGILNQVNADPAKQIEDLQSFALKSHGETQATFAELYAGSVAAKKGDKDKAVQIYDAVAADTKADPAFRQFADLMSVQVQMDTGNAAVLEKRLQPLVAENAPWRFTAMEYEGYLALRAGDKPKARQIFTDLSQDAGVPRNISMRAADMLRLLAE